ncbi:hypothetical protein NQ317_013972 [Molorchus minor]|uniref:Uncharacterized protein n=1 Tax=Molorchus minor TaxID=1323400 RepID=A0ABQ9IW18_9CUCU|nr:hypothetical protein NQ317_013972 [Molorchus minor]
MSSNLRSEVYLGFLYLGHEFASKHWRWIDGYVIWGASYVVRRKLDVNCINLHTVKKNPVDTFTKGNTFGQENPVHGAEKGAMLHRKLQEEPLVFQLKKDIAPEPGGDCGEGGYG